MDDESLVELLSVLQLSIVTLNIIAHVAEEEDLNQQQGRINNQFWRVNCQIKNIRKADNYMKISKIWF
jgi:hypothetical protein